MRVYIPATIEILRFFHSHNQLPTVPVPAHGVTPQLREWYLNNDNDELEYAAYDDCAVSSFMLLVHAGTAGRRVVIAVDTDHCEPDNGQEIRSAMKITQSPSLVDCASIHVDSLDALPQISQAVNAYIQSDEASSEADDAIELARDHELEWYAPSEISALLEPNFS